MTTRWHPLSTWETHNSVEYKLKSLTGLLVILHNEMTLMLNYCQHILSAALRDNYKSDEIKPTLVESVGQRRRLRSITQLRSHTLFTGDPQWPRGLRCRFAAARLLGM